MVIFHSYVSLPEGMFHHNGINKPLDGLIGRVPFKYQIMTIGGVPP